MAYQNVGTPRFYVDYLSYWHSQGLLRGVGTYSWYSNDLIDGSLFGLNPSNTTEITANVGNNAYFWLVFNFYNHAQTVINYETIPNAKMFSGVLGHNFASLGNDYTSRETNIEGSGSEGTVGDGIINPLNELSSLDGFTIIPHTPNTTETSGIHFKIFATQGDVFNFGSFVYGNYYDMPHSPDLSLTMSHEYDGLKTVETKGGAILSDMRYHKVPMWGENKEAWQLGDWQQLNSGRRVWDLSFSYLSASDIEPYSHSWYEWTSDTDMGIGATEPAQDNWFTNVLYYTNGGQLPFIFQPDKDATYDEDTYTVPEFAICRFDMDTFTRTQVSSNVYNMKIKIVESW